MTSAPSGPPEFPGAPRMTEAEARRVRPLMSGVIALVVALVVAIGWYYAGRPDESTRPREVLPTAEWATWVRSGRTDAKLTTFAPMSLPKGWEVRSARYVTGVDAHWHLGLLTDEGKYVGLEESKDPTRRLVEQFVDDDAVEGDDITLAGETWKVWTDAGGDYALTRSLTGPDGQDERLLVVGSAADQDVRDFAASLSATAVPTP